MTDILFFCSTLVIVGVAMILFRIFEQRNECHHDWNNWVQTETDYPYRDWETDRKSTRLNSSHRL